MNSEKQNNINFVVENKLCTGCGVCEGACPTKSINFFIKHGQFIPFINNDTCNYNKGCHLCYNTCPGIGVDLSKIAKNIFSSSNTKYNDKLGRYLMCFTGYSLNYETRYHCASGGMISQFLVWLLEKKIIDGAFVSSFDPDNQMLVRSFVATTKEDILSSKSSKYSPVTLNSAIREIKGKKGKFIIVGLPCHIHGFRKYEQIDVNFKKKIVGYFGLFCSGGRTFYLTEHIFRELGIDKNGLEYLSYRDEGCLGNLVVKGKNIATLKPFNFKIKYQHYYHPLRSFFIPRRCLFCIDHFSELADVSFGDIYIEPYSKDNVGINSLLVRNPKFLTWVKKADFEGSLKVDSLEEEILIKSQSVIYQKKNRSSTFLMIDRWRSRPVPHYDVDLKDNFFLKSLISYLHTLTQIFIGRHKSLWFIISFLKRKPSID